MVTLAQRLEELRTEAGLSRPALAAALGFPKGSIEKFETGRQTPTKEQQERIAGHFGVSLFYLRGESGDRTRMDDWMSGAYREEEPGHVPTPARQPRPKAPAPEPASYAVELPGSGSLRRSVESQRVAELHGELPTPASLAQRWERDSRRYDGGFPLY